MKIARLRTRFAFTLVEVLIGLAVFGLLAAALLPALNSLDQLEQTGRAQGRGAAVIPFQEQLLSRGLNPVTNSVTANPALSVVRTSAPGITRTAWLDRPGRVSVWRIQSEATTSGKMMAFGFQLGGGANLDNRKPLVEPLRPLRISEPTWSPTGPVLGVDSVDLPPETPNAPWRVRITVSSDPTSRVKMRLFGPAVVSADSIGSSSIEVSAMYLAAGASLEAWAEYAGTAGDTSDVLADGRTRWWTSTAQGLQLWEPSSKILRTYKIDVGAPVLAIAGANYPSGATIPIDWALRASAVASAARVQFPSNVSAKFGSARFATGYTVSFQGRPGSESGDVTDFFAGNSLDLWTEVSTLTSSLTGHGSGLVSAEGVWSFVITPTTLGAPNLAPSSYDPTYYDGGDFTLSAPLVDGVPIGRVSSDEYESTGPTLTRSPAHF